VLSLWLLLCWSLALSSAGPEAWALGKHYQRSLKRQFNFIISKHPRYLWGGSSDLEKGLDCSGYLFLAAKWAAIPGITRTTSVRMSMGSGGWTGRDISLDEADECDLTFWTFADNRPCGHVGALLRDANGKLKVTHAGVRRGVVLENLRGPMFPNLTKVRRLTIGD